MVWFDGTPAEPSDEALYSAWQGGQPSNEGNENCAYLNFHEKSWNDNKCNYEDEAGPYVLCQKTTRLNESYEIDE